MSTVNLTPTQLAYIDINYDMKVIIDETVSGTTYYGFAERGSATSGALWKIKRIVQSGGTTTITWADQLQIWDNRSSLTYT